MKRIELRKNNIWNKTISIFASIVLVFGFFISFNFIFASNRSKSQKEEVDIDSTKGVYVGGIYFAGENQDSGVSVASASDKGAFVIQSGTSLTIGEGFEISGFEAYYGGAIFVESGATLTIQAGAKISGNTGRLGGAVYVESGGTLQIETFKKNNKYAQITDNYSEPLQEYTLKYKSLGAEGSAAAIYAESGAHVRYKSTSSATSWTEVNESTTGVFNNVIKNNIAQYYGNYVAYNARRFNGTTYEDNVIYQAVGGSTLTAVSNYKIQLDPNQSGWNETEKARGYKLDGDKLFVKPILDYNLCSGYFSDSNYYTGVDSSNASTNIINDKVYYKTNKEKTFYVFGLKGAGEHEAKPNDVNFFGKESFAGLYTKEATLDKLDLVSEYDSDNKYYYAKASIKGTATGEIVFPCQAKINGENYEVEKIQGYSTENPSNNTNVTSVFIPDSVKTISSRAFIYCCGLKEVVIGRNVTSIGNNAFSRCPCLQNVIYKARNVSSMYTGKVFEAVYPEEITNNIGTDEYGLKITYKVQTNPFCIVDTKAKDGNLKSAYQFNYDENQDISKEYYGTAYADYITTDENKKLKVTFVGVDSLPTHLFEYCYSLKEVDFVGCENLSVSSYCFDSCVNLTTVSGHEIDGITESKNFVRRFNYRAFAECRRLTQMGSVANQITIPSMAEASLTNKPFEDIFHGCASMVNVELPTDLTELGAMSFRGCNNLEKVTFRAEGSGNIQMEWIGGSAFYHTKLKQFNDTTNDGVNNINLPNGVELGSYIFAYSTVNNVNLPSGITKISDGLFKYCKSLNNINGTKSGAYCNLPDGIARIGTEAFYGCSSLFIKRLPATIEYVGTDAFKVILESSVRYSVVTSVNSGNAYYVSIGITNDDLYGVLLTAIDPDITSVTINPKTKVVASSAFANCSKLESIEFVEGIEYIGDSVCSGCTKLKKVYIPYSLNVTEITEKDENGYDVTVGFKGFGKNVFASCPKTLKVFSGLGHGEGGREKPVYDQFSIWESCYGVNLYNATVWGLDTEFYWNWTASTLTIIGKNPEKSTSTIGCTVPYVMKNVNGNYFPSAVNIAIADEAFKSDTTITSVTLTPAVISIGNNAFEGCTALTTVSVYNYNDYKYNDHYWQFSPITSSSVSDGLDTINKGELKIYYADPFSNPDGQYTDVGTGGSGSRVKYYKQKLRITTKFGAVVSVRSNGNPIETTYTDWNNNKQYDSIDNYWIDPNSGEEGANVQFMIYEGYYWYREVQDNSGSGTTATLPTSTAGTDTIGTKAFYGCSALKNVNFPSSLKKVGDEAFRGCSNFESLSAYFTNIGPYAFYYCQKLLTFNLGGQLDLKTIGNYAFYNCSSLTGSSGIPSKITSIGSYAFYNCSKLTGALVIPNSVTSIGAYAFYNTGYSSVEIGTGLTTINYATFAYCSKLEKVWIPSNVTTIMSDEFTSKGWPASLWGYNTPANIPPFYKTKLDGESPVIKIYCQASKKLDNWGTDWYVSNVFYWTDINGNIGVWNKPNTAKFGKTKANFTANNW